MCVVYHFAVCLHTTLPCWLYESEDSILVKWFKGMQIECYALGSEADENNICVRFFLYDLLTYLTPSTTRTQRIEAKRQRLFFVLLRHHMAYICDDVLFGRHLRFTHIIRGGRIEYVYMRHICQQNPHWHYGLVVCAMCDHSSIVPYSLDGAFSYEHKYVHRLYELIKTPTKLSSKFYFY